MDYKRNSERLAEVKRKREEEGSKNSSSSSVSKTSKNSDKLRKRKMESTIKLDTFEADLSNIGSTVSNIYSTWQDSDTLNQTKSSVESIYNRLNTYKEYSNTYGVTPSFDVDAVLGGYQTVLDDWDKLSSTYGYYENADAFNTAKKQAELAQKFSGLTYDDVKAEKSKYAPDSDEYKYLSTYTNYSDLKDYDKALADLEGGAGSHTSGSGVKHGGGSGKRRNTVDSSGVTESGRSHSGGSTEVDYIDFDGLKSNLQEARNVYALDHAFDLHKDVMNNEDFAEKSQYAPTELEGWWDKFTKGQYGLGYGDITYEYINNEDARAEIEHKAVLYGADTGDTSSSEFKKAYHELTEEEKAVYRYYYAIDKEEGTNKAQEFLDDMEITLTKRANDKSAQNIEAIADSGFGASVGISALSVPMNIMGAVTGTIETVGDAIQGKEYNPYGYYKSPTNFASNTRESVGENIAEETEGMEIFGQNIPSFLYQTGMSSLDSLASMGVAGKGAPLLLGASSAMQTAKELKEAGASEEEITRGALASGAFEVVFEKVGIDNLFKAKSADSVWKIVKETFKQAGIEGLEETGTEISNILFDSFSRGESSDAYKQYQEYLSRGFTEEEAMQKLAVDLSSQVAWAGIGGALSGAGMGGVSTTANYSGLKSEGAQIRSNDRVQEMLDIAGMTPEESEAYKAYNAYAGKGITADNIKDAQLGNLYASTANDIESTLKSKKTTTDQKADASLRLNKLGVVQTAKTEEERATQQRLKRLATGETTAVVTTGNSAKIEGIRMGDGNTVLLTSEGEVAVEDMTFNDKDAELVAYAEGMDEAKANLLISQYDGNTDVESYVASFNLAYHYGELGYTADSILQNKGVLTEQQASEIYKATILNQVTARQKAVDEINAKYGKNTVVAGIFDDSVIDYNNSTADGSKVNWNSLTSRQRSAVRFTQAFSKVTGVNIVFTNKGMQEGYNGKYDSATNTITLDIYAGVDKINAKELEDSIIPTLSHEMTHWMKDKSPAMYHKMREYVLNTLTEVSGISQADSIAYEMNRIKEKHPDMDVTEEYAIDEIVARACEDMLSNSDKMRELLNTMSKSEQQSFIDKVKETFKNLIEWVNNLLTQYKSNSTEAKILREYEEKLKELSKIWDEALAEAIQTNQSLQKEGITGEQAINEATEKVGITVDMETESAYPSVQFSERTWTESEYVQNREVAIANLAKALGVSKEQASEYIDGINSVAYMIASDRERLDYESNVDESATVVKPNSEYKWSVDMSTLCAKRLYFTGTFDAVQKLLPNTALDSDDIVRLRAMMMEAGYEVACGICYVESTRREIGTITADFIERYKIAQKTGKPITRLNSEGKEVELKEKGTGNSLYTEEGYTPTLAKLNTTDIDLVKRDHPSVYSAYLAYMNARGQAKPKLLETRAEYKGEILKHFKAKSAVEARNNAGGLRLQSFSDFETPHLIDMMQVVMDMARVGLKSQAYTKVVNFAEAFGDTGVKINLSLIAKGDGVDENGNLIFDDVEGINHEEAFRLREKYSKNVGTILVGKNDAHIIKAMADPRIDYIIPFHKSSWKESLYDALGLTGYDDYTETQNEKAIDKSRKIKNFDPSEYWDFSKSGDENAQIYLAKCKEDGRIPKFPQFAQYEGYWKLLIDFKMYDNDGVGSPQTTVMPNFNMEEARRILEEYKGGHRNFPVANDVVDKFVAEYKKGHPQEQYSDREVTPLTAEDYKAMKAHFGTTGNYNVAGYLLQDGYMLDFSGKHWGDTTSRTRQVDHRDIQEVIADKNNGFDSMVRMISNGNIRLMPESGGINLAVAPTKNQRTILRRYIDYMNQYQKEGFALDIDEVGGNTIKSFTYEAGTSADRILGDIDRYFKGGNQSDLMRFHTQYSDRDYMDAINRGDMETAQKMVDEVAKNKGYSDKVYHGTKAEFTIFKQGLSGGIYMATNRKVAEGFARDGSVKALYTKFENPMVINALIPPTDVWGGYKMPYYYEIPTPKEMVDGGKYGETVSTEEISVYAQNNGYDGVIIHNMKELDGLGTSDYIAFNPNQIKSADAVTYDDNGNVIPLSKRFNNETSDIRYSDRDNVSVYDSVGEIDRLAEENAMLKEDIGRLKSVISPDEVDIKRFKSLADYLKKLAGSQYSRETLGAELKDLYTFIQTAENLQWTDVVAQTYDIASRIMNPMKDVPINYFKNVMAEIRNDKVSLSADQRTEAENLFNGYGNFHKYMFGRVNITTNGMSLEEAWTKWASKYPTVFDANIKGVDQVKALVEIVDALKATSSMMGEYEREEAIRHLSTEVYNQMWNIASDKSDEVRKARASHRQMMEKLRKDYEARQKEKTLHPVGEVALKYEKLLKNTIERDKRMIAKAKEHGREKTAEYKDRVARNAKIESITKKSLTLNQWLTKNSKDEHIPEVMKAPVAYLLNAIDFSSKQLLGMSGGIKAGTETRKDISLSKALEQVHDMVSKINSAQIGEDEITEIYGTFADFPMGFADDIRELSGKVNDIMRTVGDNAYTLNQMSLEELETLDKIVTTIKATVTKMNKFLAIRHAEGVANLSQQSIVYMDSLGKADVYDGIAGKADSMLGWGNALPYYVFKRFGEGGQKVYEALQDGWDKFAFHTKAIIDYAENTYESKDVKEWEKDIKEFDVLEPATEEEKKMKGYEPKYQKLQMSVPQIMSLYCLQKREQAKGHLMGGGIRVTDIQTKDGIISQSEGVILTESELDTIINSLTDKQRKVADALQKFMNTTCTEWGNEVSMLRFGFKAFGEENYFPIQSDKNNLAVNDETEQNNSLFRLLNMSFTKGTIQKANNRVVISDIFDVFAQHSTDMAKYNALALPVIDAFKWYNYKEKIQKGETQFNTKSLKQSLESAFGKDGQNYFVTFLRDINGEKNVGRDTLSNGFFTNAKIASVGFNLKVMALQPTSYLRAQAVIDPKYLTQALAHKPKTDMAQKYCGIALWKSLGFYDINVQRSVTDLIKHDETWRDWIAEKSMKGAGLADELTWGYLWNACEAEVKDTQRKLKVGSEEYYTAVGKRLREIIYTTQVVDSTMTRSQMMRSSDGRDKMLTAFASEPTLAFNMLQDCYFDWKLTERQTGSKQKAFKKHGKKLARVAYAYTITNAITALLETGFEIFRDDEEERDEEEIIKMFLENFGLNMSIANKIPYVKEAISILQGFASSRMDTQWMQYFAYTIKGAVKLMNGEGDPYTTAKNGFKAFSYLSGLPFYSALRDIKAMWNSTIGEIYPSTKLK